MGEDKSSSAAQSYGVDWNWYADSGATDHVTGELDKLTKWDTYNRKDQIYTASGTCMHIKHIDQSIIRTPSRDLSLPHVLHVLKASKSLASIHRIRSDNNIFFELHPDFFFIKDQESRKTLLRDQSRGGLYRLSCSTSTLDHTTQALSSTKISSVTPRVMNSLIFVINVLIMH
jgi:hypothetical protein